MFGIWSVVQARQFRQRFGATTIGRAAGHCLFCPRLVCVARRLQVSWAAAALPSEGGSATAASRFAGVPRSYRREVRFAHHKRPRPFSFGECILTSGGMFLSICWGAPKVNRPRAFVGRSEKMFRFSSLVGLSQHWWGRTACQGCSIPSGGQGSVGRDIHDAVRRKYRARKSFPIVVAFQLE